MKKHVAGALLMAVYWFFAGFALGMFMEGVDPHGEWVDIWPAVFAYPGFAGGLLFYSLLSMGERGRGYREIAVSRGALWGGLAGLLLPVLFIGALGMGLGDMSDPTGGFFLPLAIASSTVGGAVAGAATIAVARRMVAAF